MASNRTEKEEAQDRADRSKEIADAVAAAVAQALPLAMAGVAQILKPAPVATTPAPLFSPSDRCTKCLQFRSVCKDKHVLLNVAPANPRRYTRFPGITINGITYLSPRPGAPIYVPESNDILYQLQRYEDEEDNLKEGNSVSHNTGTLSPIANKQSIAPANPLGFRGMNTGAPS